MPSLLETITIKSNAPAGALLYLQNSGRTDSSTLQHNPERLAESLPPRLGNCQSARVPLLRYPAQFEAAGCQRRPQTPRKMWPPLAPIQARPAEYATARRWRGTESI